MASNDDLKDYLLSISDQGFLQSEHEVQGGDHGTSIHHMHEEMFQYQQDLITYDVLSSEIDASSLQSSDSHDCFNISDATHKYFVSGHHQKVRGDLVILDSSKENYVYHL